MEVRICACPGRDRKVDDRSLSPPTTQRSVKRPASDMDTQPAKRSRTQGNQEVFTLTITGRENYEMLCRIRDSLELAALIPKSQVQAYNQLMHQTL